MTQNYSHKAELPLLPCRIAVVIPCFKVTRHILAVLATIGPEVSRIVVVDDACPESSGDFVATHTTDPRIMVVRHAFNKGVGGAVVTGYEAAMADGCDIMVKLDGDGQMNPCLIPAFVEPLHRGLADYAKGNRFFDIETVRAMPAVRLWGNAALSFWSKLSTGYWHVFDPTNGYTAIRSSVAQHLRLHKLSERYFFESDMLFRLSTLRAVVVDIPMVSHYADETSHLQVRSIVVEFAVKHLRNFAKRLAYNYFVRDVSLASFELVFGLLLMTAGAGYGAWHWMQSAHAGITTPAGTVMMAAFPMLVGFQLLLAFVGADIAAVPKQPVGHALARQAPSWKT